MGAGGRGARGATAGDALVKAEAHEPGGLPS